MQKSGNASAEEIKNLKNNLSALENVIDKSSESMDNVSKSAADMKGSLDDTKDATDGLEKALSVLDATDNSVIKGFRDILNYAKNASKGFSDMKKAVDSYKKGATGADKATKGLTSSLLKNPLTIIIGLVALLVAGIVKWVKVTREQAKAIRELELDKFEKHLENINNIYDRYDKILSKLGATQSQMTESNIRRMEDELRIMENKNKLLHTQFEETEASFKIIGNQTELYEAQYELYAKLDDEQKKYVDQIIESNKKIAELKSNIELARNFTIKIEKASEQYTKELEKQSLQYKKADVALKSENVQLQSKLNLLEQLGNYTQDYYDIENKLFENEQKNNKLQMQNNRKQIEELNRMKSVYEEAIKSVDEPGKHERYTLLEALNGRPEAVSEARQSWLAALTATQAYEEAVRKIDTQISGLTLDNSILSNNIKNNETILNSKYMLRLNQALKDGDETMVRYLQDAIRFYAEYRTHANKEGDPFYQIPDLVQASYKWLGDFNKRLDESKVLLKEFGIELSGNAPASIVDAIKELNKLSDKQKQTPAFANAMNTMTKLAQEYYLNIDKSNNALKSSVSDLTKLLDNMSGLEKMFAEMGYATFELRDNVYDISEELKQISIDEETYGKEAVEQYQKLIQQLELYRSRSRAAVAETVIETKRSELEFMNEVSGIGKFTLRDIMDTSKYILVAEKEYQKAMIDQHAIEMKDAGIEEIEVEKWVANQKAVINQQFFDKKKQMYLDFANESLDISNNMVQDFTSIMGDINSIYEQEELDRIKRLYGEESRQYDQAVREYKKKEGALLAASTISNAAQAFGSTYASAPGGAAAKAAQAALASAAVIANGVRAYNELMRVDRENNKIASQGQQTGVSSVTETLVARGIASPQNDDVRYILPVDDVTAIQMSQNRIRISAQM